MDVGRNRRQWTFIRDVDDFFYVEGRNNANVIFSSGFSSFPKWNVAQ